MKRAIAVLCLFAFASAFARADYLPAPRQYSFINAVDGQTSTVYRNGDKAAVDIFMPRGKYRPKDMHIHMIVDIPSSKSLQWDLTDPKAACSAVTGTWGDPFEYWTQMLDTKTPPRKVGKETINGFSTTVYEMSGPGGAKARLWRDDKYGLLIKSVMSVQGKTLTAVNVREFKVGTPPASAFVIPARCRAQAPH